MPLETIDMRLTAITAELPDSPAITAMPGQSSDRLPHPFLLRSHPFIRVEIPGRFSSSLLPPSFVRGRFATLLSTPHGAASGAVGG